MVLLLMKVLAYAKTSKLAWTPFAAVGGNNERCKKVQLVLQCYFAIM